VLGFLAVLPVRAQTCAGPVDLHSQADGDAFNCVTVEGDLRIFPTSGQPVDITNLNGLSELSTVTGSLRISDVPNLSSLSGLGALQTVGEVFGLDELPLVTSLPLASLTTVGGLSIARMNLTSLGGLAGLTAIAGVDGQAVFINDNDQLLSLSGLHNLATVGATFTVIDNGKLPDLDELNLTALGGSLVIADNEQLTSLFTLPEAGQVRLAVYDVLGREVARLVDGALSAGSHRVTFEAGNLPWGAYLYGLEAGTFVQVRHMVLMTYKRLLNREAEQSG
jgi:hypothetical protein